MIYYELYGFTLNDIESARKIVEDSLNISFEIRDSFYVGDYYKYKNDRGEEFFIKENKESFEEGEEDYREPDFKDFPILLYIDESNEENVKRYKAALLAYEQIIFLRQEIF